MVDIKDVGILCASCGGRNIGDSSLCKYCGNRLVELRPLSEDEAADWAASQVALRHEKGVEVSDDDEHILCDWATTAEIVRPKAAQAQTPGAAISPGLSGEHQIMRSAARTASSSTSTASALAGLLIMVRGFALYMMLGFLSVFFGTWGLAAGDNVEALFVISAVFGLGAFIGLAIAYQRSGEFQD